jgi:WhiB family transcriptional regulator, redox-sensing transcriptional regulator
VQQHDFDDLFGHIGWMRGAACVEAVDVEFFPARGASTRPAKAVCARCPVRERCLRFALDERIAEGVWGGLSPQERRQLATGRRRRTRGVEPPA